MKSNSAIQWKDHLDDADIVAASQYLELNMPRDDAKEAVQKFKEHRDRIEWYKAKDLLRSAGLPPLDNTSTGVEHKLDKVKDGTKLTPALLVLYHDKLIIADGYHRVSAMYQVGETEEVAAVLVHVKNKE